MSPSISAPEPSVFISYSQAATVDLARDLQGGLQSFAKPWWIRRAVRVIRDESDLGTTPELWPSIMTRLEMSGWLVLIATPKAAGSKWVKRELRFWLRREPSAVLLGLSLPALDEPIADAIEQHRRKLLIVLADGEIVWDDGARDFDWLRTNALPRCLTGVFAHEPLWVDLRQSSALGRSKPAILNAVARLSVPIRGLELAELVGEDLRRHRQALRSAKVALAALALLVAVTGTAAWLANTMAGISDWRQEIALAQRQVVEAQALASREPAALPRAAWQARKVWGDLQRLAGPPPVPSTLRAVARQSRKLGVHFLDGLEADFRLSADVRRPVDEILRLADDITPSLAAVVEEKLEEIRWVTFLPGGERVAYIPDSLQVSFWPPSKDNARIPLPKPTYRPTGGQFDMAGNGLGTVIAVATENDLVVVQDLVTGETTHSLPLDQIFARHELTDAQDANSDPGSTLAGIVLNQDGRRLALISRSGAARLVHLSENGQFETPSPAWVMARDRYGRFTQMRWILNAAGDLLAGTPASVGDRVPTWVWNATDGKPLPGTPFVQNSMVEALAFLPGSNELVIGDKAGSIFVRDLSTGDLVQTISFGEPVCAVASGPGVAKGFILVGGTGNARVFDWKTRREIARVTQPGRVSALAWSADGRRFATGETFGDGRAPLRIWNLDTPAASVARMRSQAALKDVTQAKGRLVATGSTSFHSWQTATGVELASYDGREIAAGALGFDPASQAITMLAAENWGGHLAVRFDLVQRTSTKITVRKAGPFVPAQASLDARGTRLVRILEDTLELWDLSQPARVFHHPTGAGATLPMLSPDGLRIVWAGGDGSVHSVGLPGGGGRNWSTGAGTFDMRRIAPAFSADSKRMAVVNFNQVLVVDSFTGAPVAPVIVIPPRMDGESVRMCALDLSGEWLVAGLSTLLFPLNRLVIAKVADGEVISFHPFPTESDRGGGIAISDDASVYAVFNDYSADNPRVWRWRLHLDDVTAALKTRLVRILALETAWLGKEGQASDGGVKR